MSKVFYISEILDFAVEREKQSQKLYKELAKKVEVPELKTIFKRLVQEEAHHEEIYQHMLDEVKKEYSVGAPAGEEYNDYMRVLIDDSRKQSPVKDIHANDIDEILDYAIGREKDAIVFYLGLKNYIPTSAQNQIDRIIKEEATHMVLLSNMKRKM